MTCRWYISIQAIRDWQRIAGYPQQEDGPWFDRAEGELMDLAGQAKLRRTSQGYLEYRVKATVRDRRTRLDLIVSDEIRPEGPLPQLVKVRAAGRHKH